MSTNRELGFKGRDDAYEKFIAACDLAIREGRVQEVVQKLSELNVTKIPRKWRQPLARLSRRTGNAALGLRILARIVRPKAAGPKTPATSFEIAEYAALLQMYGSVREAVSLLSSLDPSGNPEVHLFKAYGHFNLWEYAEAIPHLEKYSQCDLAPYQLRVGMVNLAAAYLGAGRLDAAMSVIEKEIAVNTREGHQRLAGNCHEIRAQILIQKERYSEAKEDLQMAASKLGVSRAFDLTFVRKWSAVIDARETGSFEALFEFREHAHRRHEWESVRDADRQLLRLKFDQERFNRLAFGTPFKGYVDAVVQECGGKITQDSYVWGDPTRPCLNLINGEFNGKPGLEPGGKIHQVIEVLSRDFYRPLTIGALFAALFAGEYFDIFSSPNRIHQCVFRARDWLDEQNIDLKIEEHDGCYRLALGANASVRVRYERNLVTQFDFLFSRLRAHLGNGGRFAATEGARILGLSRSSFQRFASEAVERGLLQMQGVTKSARYVFAPTDTAQSVDVKRAA